MSIWVNGHNLFEVLEHIISDIFLIYFSRTIGKFKHGEGYFRYLEADRSKYFR